MGDLFMRDRIYVVEILEKRYLVREDLFPTTRETQGYLYGLQEAMATTGDESWVKWLLRAKTHQAR